MTEVKSIGNPICHLAECPIWNVAEQTLYWTDILEKRIWKYDPQGEVIRTEWVGDMEVGGFAFTESGDIIMCTDKGVYRLQGPAGSEARSDLSLLWDIPMADDERFNDITTDPRGRILAGTLTDRRVEGILYRLEKGKSPAILLRDIGTSNGMTFSLDLKHFYHTDSHARTITRYDYDLDSGEIANPAVMYQAAEGNGVPDGITMDAEGCIWIACWRGRRVIRIDTKGKILLELPVPAVQPSSVAFGGEQMDELYVTSACQGAADLTRGLDQDGRYLGGDVFRAPVGIKGRTEWPADM
jgi:sugar lactone lactonase YvrE